MILPPIGLMTSPPTTLGPSNIGMPPCAKLLMPPPSALPMPNISKNCGKACKLVFLLMDSA